MAESAILFPGQGSLTPDAGELARTHWPELVARADELAGRDVFASAARSTAYAQPAIFVASIAGWRSRGDDVGDVIAMAGHSLGELSALAAAGAVAVDDALRLVVLRGRLMAEAASTAPSEGGMIALLGGDAGLAMQVARDHGLSVANDNAPGQVVLSGPRAAFDGVTLAARAEGFKALPLDVSGAFHSAEVASARQPFLDALRATEWRTPSVPVVSCLTAAPFTDPPRELADALTSPVRWRETVGTLVALGAREFVDVGPGRVLQRLVARNLGAMEKHALAR